MSIETLLQTRELGCTKLERFANRILAFPRVVWLGRKISVETVDNQLEIKKDLDIDSLTLKYVAFVTKTATSPIIAGLFITLSTLFYAATAIFAAPFLGVGLMLKKVSLITDDKAYAYYHLIEKVIATVKLDQKIDVLKEKRQFIEEQGAIESVGQN